MHGCAIKTGQSPAASALRLTIVTKLTLYLATWTLEAGASGAVCSEAGASERESSRLRQSQNN